MSCDESSLKELGPLLLAGRLDEFHRQMLAQWPPERRWTQDDVGLVCALLSAVHQQYRERMGPIYRSFSSRLKSAGADRWWLSTLVVRAETVAEIEGPDSAVKWLRELLSVVPPPSVGFVHLTLGRLLQRLPRLDEARHHLGEAAYLSLCGVEWFSLEAFSEMRRCLCQQGEGLLAFEYSRCHALTSYRLGRITGEQLPQALEGLAAIYGQIDYWCELNRNFADHSRRKGEFSVAAERESQAAFRLAQIGALVEAAEGFARAMTDAQHGSWRSDRPFALTCRHLSLFLDPAPLTGTAVDQAMEECRKLWLPEEFVTAWRDYSAGRQWEMGGAWACNPLVAAFRGQVQARSLQEDHGEFLNLVQLLALTGRLCRDAGNIEAAAQFWSAVLSLPGRTDAIFVFVAEALAELWLQRRRPDPALAIAESFVRRKKILPHERFLFRALSARAQFARHETQAAFVGANAALSDWGRVLEGLFIEDHKAAWLQRGAPVIDCALAAIESPVPWLEEQKRRREVFRLCELGKARMLTDLVARDGRLVGAFSAAASTDQRSIPALADGGLGLGDWLVPLMVQAISLNDMLELVVHAEDGSIKRTSQTDVAPLKYAVRLPVSPARRLVVSAASLPFAEADLPANCCLSDDITQFFQTP